MYIVNKIVGVCVNPLVIGMMLIAVGGVMLWRGWRKTGFGFLGVSFVWFWLWSTPMMYRYPVLDRKKICKSMRKPALVFDTRNCLDTVAFRKFGFRIFHVGKGN